MTGASSRLAWRELHLPRPLEIDRATALLRRLSTDSKTRGVVFEARGNAGMVRYLIGTTPQRVEHIEQVIRGELPKVELLRVSERSAAGTAGNLKATTRHRQLRVDDPLPPVRSVLGAVAAAREGETVVLQVVLGAGRVPLAIPNQSPSSTTASWWEPLWYGNRGALDGEKRSALRTKVGDHGFACVVRIGATGTTARRRQLIDGVLAALRTSEAPGVRLRLRRGDTQKLNNGTAPWLFWPLRLGVRELLIMLAWSLGDGDLPGHVSIHPRKLVAPRAVTEHGRVIARSGAPGRERELLRLTAHDARQHLHVIGPTGVGKSVLLGRLVAQDIAAGRGVVVIEPKGDLVDDVLRQIPPERVGDVVVLDPADDAPVGLNPLRAPGRSGDAVVEGLVSVFRALYGEALGPRSGDVLHSSLLTLARHPNASLVMLPLLLTNAGFRRSLTQAIDDPIGLSPFWAWFEALSDAERRQVIAPLMNKLRPWLLNRRLRAVIGQREPRFSMLDVFTQRKVLLVPLRTGVVGEEAARLLGSLAVAQLWQTIQARSRIPAERRHTVTVYIDEVQDYLHLPTDLGEALAQARGLGCGFTLAHQFMNQLSPTMQAGVLANARSRVCFQLGHADAVTLAKGHSELTPDDLTALGAYEVYASLHAAGKTQPYASGVTFPLPLAISDGEAIRARSRTRYGRTLDEIEADFANLVDREAGDGTTGRRRRTP